MSVIDKVLEKRGLKPEELTPEERVTIDSWRSIFEGSEVSVKSIGMFCENNIKTIESKFKEIDTPPQKLQALVLLHSVYSSLLSLINNPQAEKKALEEYLSSLL